MKRNTSRSLQQSEKYKSSRSEDLEVSRSRSEEEKMLRRREWRIQQDRAREHEILKQKKIYEYEMRRAREKGLPLPKPPTFGCSKSRSKSPGSQPRRTSSSATNTPILSERLESADGKVPLFKGPEGTKISAVELRRIKVDIHRNIPGKSTGSELLRDIINPEDVIVKRRAGEGSKPIFEREEIKGITTKAEEVEEHRTVVTVNNETIDSELKTFKKRSTSSSPIKTRSSSPRHTSSRLSRHGDSKHEDKRSYRNDRDRYHSRGEGREHRDSYRHKERRHTQSQSVEEERGRKSRDHSHSREREERKYERDSYHRDDRSYREYRERSRERSRDRRDRDRSRDQRVPMPHYIEQIPVPVCYGHFPPRPIMMAPMVPIRSQVPMGSSRHPSMMGPLRPFAPRFILPDVHRLRAPPNPRFGPMF
ncbi:feminizer [Augochlora pura]